LQQELDVEPALDKEKAQLLAEKLASMRALVEQSLDRTRELEVEEKKLKRKAEVELRRAESSESGGSAMVMALKEERDDAETDLVYLSERITSHDVDIRVLSAEKSQQQDRLTEMREDARCALLPMIHDLQKEHLELRSEIEEGKSKLKSVQKEKQRTDLIYADIEKELNQVAELKKRESNHLAKASAIPETARKQIELVQSSLKSFAELEKQLDTRIATAVASFTALYERKQKLDAKLVEEQRIESNVQYGLRKQEKLLADCQCQIETAVVENETLHEAQVYLDIQVKGTIRDNKRERDLLQRRQHEKDVALRRLKRLEKEVEETKNSVPPLERQKITLLADKERAEVEKSTLIAAVAVIREESSAKKDQLVQENLLTDEVAKELMVAHKETRDVENRIVQLRAEAEITEREFRALASSRDRLGRQLGAKLFEVKETYEQVHIKDLVVKDLKKQRRLVLARVKEFEQLFDLVKNQRNKFVNLIQAAKQSMAEMKEKLRVLDNEVDILRVESTERTKSLQRREHENQLARVQRDGVRNELTRAVREFQKRQSVVDQQINEIDRLNGTINRAEREMLRLKKQYETMVEARNYTGLLLVDRNDELCILYEKRNVQNEALVRGEMELKDREDEIRMLKIHLQEARRSLEASRKKSPMVPMYDKEIATLKAQLDYARKKSAQLTATLEDPSNEERFRLLDNVIPDKDEINAKLVQVERRLNDKKEQLLEKELVSQEIAKLCGELQKQAIEGRDESLGLAKKANHYQRELRAVNRSLMAVMSELSMYQASALKLEADKKGIEELVEEAKRRWFTLGMAPTEDAEREWYRIQREKEVRKEMKEREERERKEQELEALGLITTAEQRPNAYVVLEEAAAGGPIKPFANNFAPFKTPTELAKVAVARHIKQPQPREIVL